VACGTAGHVHGHFAPNVNSRSKRISEPPTMFGALHFVRENKLESR
jgi:hypothetical protein